MPDAHTNFVKCTNDNHCIYCQLRTQSGGRKASSTQSNPNM